MLETTIPSICSSVLQPPGVTVCAGAFGLPRGVITTVDRFEIRTSTAIVAPPTTASVPLPSMSARENWSVWLPLDTPGSMKLPPASVTAAWPDETARTVTPERALPAFAASPLTTVPITVAVPGAVGEEGDSESLQLPTKRANRKRPEKRTARVVRRITIPSSIWLGDRRTPNCRGRKWSGGNRETFEPSVELLQSSCHRLRTAGPGPESDQRATGSLARSRRPARGGALPIRSMRRSALGPKCQPRDARGSTLGKPDVAGRVLGDPPGQGARGRNGDLGVPAIRREPPDRVVLAR